MLSFYSGLAVIFATLSAAQPFNCVITVPTNPLTAAGLASVYKVTGCNQIDFSDQGNFVEAAILDPATGDIEIYHPLLINQDQDVEGVDFITPVTPTLPANAVVGIWFGSNANTIKLVGDTVGCVNGDGNSVFGQFAYCNAPAFFTAAETAVSSGLLKIPPPGTSTKTATVQPCPVTRDFRVVDMDQSDNVDTSYLLIDGKTLAQNTPANAAANKNATLIQNGSDNLLINDFIAPTMGCGSFTTKSITTPNGISGAMVLNELQSQYFPPAGGPALVPLNDDFAVIASNTVTQSLVKTNLYRAGVGQPQAADAANASGVTYCQRYAASGIFIAENEALFTGATSPAPAVANNLFTFLANRFATSFGPVPSLGCATIFGVNVTNIVQQTVKDCIVTAATIDTNILQQILSGQIKPVGASAGANSAAAAGGAAGTGTASTFVTKTKTKAAGATKSAGGAGAGAGSKTHTGASTKTKAAAADAAAPTATATRAKNVWRS